MCMCVYVCVGVSVNNVSARTMQVHLFDYGPLAESKTITGGQSLSLFNSLTQVMISVPPPPALMLFSVAPVCSRHDHLLRSAVQVS
jgi:hypothetical protein